MRSYAALACCFLLLQLGFWWKTKDVVPEMDIVPNVPSQQTLAALSFGDEQFLFRLMALRLQNAGDTFGRFTALYRYDFQKLYHWFTLLDTLDNESDYVPNMATYYFAQTQNRPDIRYIVDYLVDYSQGRVKEKWWWMVQATYLANHRLKDKDLALDIANNLRDNPELPIWVQQMPAFIHEQRGEMGAALEIIQTILDHQDSLGEGELNFIQNFVDERLGRLEDIEAQLNEARKHQIPLERKSRGETQDAE